ncbi:Bis(5'-nucleosyl)-tetraphosphatase, symmetrical [Aliiroseovarius sp. xm-m-379]|uniref:metallophosphoesterase n=1 Tax=unclassified Aliiroseovarius TaxID=2623558 RepID=UPI0015688E0C|nr:MULTISPECIES: metallophosphoesterase [unclassified Aliiroseovarius]NRP13664.1 Bis(5'-nucleosyl)-tetraphosphatase, symmetrical [Aliiroseovarius sp. xm-d-517]NRP24964.1 Bis(5'-nucleosyl)-tetraphosphatase, symmetrical [Aliiroseovarius sp. xm-m-379]NRP31515.1 Bis(5'-nucleosyl)-tetraphosphatase, symmetrical [Aliiroseovarius sp. xm-m-314]NRP33763.1 Bis(5'-nucleosyl)-tetraphosphatase, symmetrical [Aliiroseovarius sp. xm-a-104]NRP41196.1 Bis(5'-nucleosyl)-tetraphosphatase, symmetrical [Aliiroseovar
MTRVYAIGDVHGHLDKLIAAHALIAEDRARCCDADAPVVHIGDLVDRGPDCKGVIQYLIDGQVRGENWVVLKGNHDRMMEMFLRDYPMVDHMLLHDHNWLHPRIGGVETLASYGVEVPEGIRTYQLHAQALAAVPQAHRRFLDTLPCLHRIEDLCFVHAGIRPGVALEDQVEDDLTWIRQEFHNSDADHGPLIVHGHTPVDEVTHYGNRLNIDTGAGHGKDIGVVVIEGRDAWVLSEDGRKPVKGCAYSAA